MDNKKKQNLDFLHKYHFPRIYFYFHQLIHKLVFNTTKYDKLASS